MFLFSWGRRISTCVPITNATVKRSEGSWERSQEAEIEAKMITPELSGKGDEKA